MAMMRDVWSTRTTLARVQLQQTDWHVAALTQPNILWYNLLGPQPLLLSPALREALTPLGWLWDCRSGASPF